MLAAVAAEAHVVAACGGENSLVWSIGPLAGQAAVSADGAVVMTPGLAQPPMLPYASLVAPVKSSYKITVGRDRVTSNGGARVEWQLFDMSGRSIVKKVAAVLEISALAPGVYVVSAAMPDGEVLKSKILKR